MTLYDIPWIFFILVSIAAAILTSMMRSAGDVRPPRTDDEALGRTIRNGAIGCLGTGLVVVALLLALLLFMQRLSWSSNSAPVPPTTSSVPQSPPVALHVGATAMVITSYMTPLYRSDEQGAPSNQVLLLVTQGQVVRIAEGPRVYRTRRWWRVDLGSHQGWLPETLDDGASVLAPH